MGHVEHEAIIVTTASYRAGGLPDIEAFRDSLPEEFRRLVIGPVESAINGCVTYAFLPVGSKRGWDFAELGDEYRDRFVALFDQIYDDGSSADHLVGVKFGSDHRCENPDGPVFSRIWPPVQRP